MHTVTPRVFVVAKTALDEAGIAAYLGHIGAETWTTDANSAAEYLVEFMGRLCYRSWAPGMNANVTRVRHGNATYLKNILHSRHGSVTEHASVSFLFADVSRVFTHELVRHRAGTAISQESLRFVRLTDLGQWLPTCITESPSGMEIFSSTFAHLEELQVRLAELFDLDNLNVNFSIKKEITSALRRLAPLGLATTIGWTANIRTIRQVLEMRTHPSAEEEMRVVFDAVGRIVTRDYPNVFQDFSVKTINGLSYYKPEYSKI